MVLRFLLNDELEILGKEGWYRGWFHLLFLDVICQEAEVLDVTYQEAEDSFKENEGLTHKVYKVCYQYLKEHWNN